MDYMESISEGSIGPYDMESRDMTPEVSSDEEPIMASEGARYQPHVTSDSVDEEEQSTVKCICGFNDDDGNTVLCEKCDTWQHIVCFYESAQHVPDVHECADCAPRPVNIYRAADLQRRRNDSRGRLGNTDWQDGHRSQDVNKGLPMLQPQQVYLRPPSSHPAMGA